MAIEVTQKPSNGSCIIDCVTNCKRGTSEGLVVNLHPDFPIPEDQLHADMAFPWLEQVHELSEIQQTLLPNLPAFNTIGEYKEFVSQLRSISELWIILKRAWSLNRSGKLDLSNAELAKYRPKDSGEKHNLSEALFDFCGQLLGPIRRKIFTDAAELLAEANRNHPSKFADFKRHHKAAIYPLSLDHYFEVFSEYFKDFGEFTQTLLMCQYNMPMQQNAIASSTAFSITRMTYGNQFEALTSQFVVLACINNILSNREFGTFQSMDLKKYLTTNKANRANPFLNLPAFAEFSKSIDSTLRNASHHGAIKLDQSGITIRFRSGGSGAEQKMRYSEYLSICNENILRLAALFMLELILAL